MWTKLIEKLAEILTANVKIQATFDYEPDEMTGSPIAIIVPSSNEGDYSTTETNVRVYAFNLKLYVNRTKNNKNDADRILRNLVDTVLDDFDKNYLLTGVEQPTGYTFINLFALPSSWGYAGLADEYRVAEINVRCRVVVDVRAIS